MSVPKDSKLSVISVSHTKAKWQVMQNHMSHLVKKQASTKSGASGSEGRLTAEEYEFLQHMEFVRRHLSTKERSVFIQMS